MKRRNDNHSPGSLNSIYSIIGIPISNTEYHILFMLGSGTKFDGSIRLFPSVRYCILPGAVWCGAVHTFSHTLFSPLVGTPPSHKDPNAGECYSEQAANTGLVLAHISSGFSYIMSNFLCNVIIV